MPFLSGFRTAEENARIPGAAPNSNHLRGLAADLGSGTVSLMRQEINKWNLKIPQYRGSTGSHVEDPTARSSVGGPVAREVNGRMVPVDPEETNDRETGYAMGGIAAGPRSGYFARLHGTEAIVPLPGGRSIPVEMTGVSDKMAQQLEMMSEQISSLNEMVSLMRANNDINNKILRYSMN